MLNVKLSFFVFGQGVARSQDVGGKHVTSPDASI